LRAPACGAGDRRLLIGESLELGDRSFAFARRARDCWEGALGHAIVRHTPNQLGEGARVAPTARCGARLASRRPRTRRAPGCRSLPPLHLRSSVVECSGVPARSTPGTCLLVAKKCCFGGVVALWR